MKKQGGPVLSQSNGFAHILLIVLLVAGLAVAIYMVQQKTNIFPKAYEIQPDPLRNSTEIVPKKPAFLSGWCDGTNAHFDWEAGSSAPATYFVRYKKNVGTESELWPAIESEGQTRNTWWHFAAGHSQIYKPWKVAACNLAGCSDYAEGPEILCTTKNEDEPLGPAGTNIINVTATCSGPDSKINSDHLDVKIDGQAYGWDKSVAIRAGITDTKTGQFANVFSEYGQPGQQTKINIDLHDQVDSTSMPFKFYPDDRVYDVSVFVQLPQWQNSLIVQARTSFSKECSFTIPTPPSIPEIPDITPPPLLSD